MSDTIKGAPLGPRVTAVTPNDNYEPLIKFNNSEKRMFDVHQLLGMTVFSPRKNISFFFNR